MKKKTTKEKKKFTKEINWKVVLVLFAILIIALIIIFFKNFNVEEKKPVFNNDYVPSDSAMMPVVKYEYKEVSLSEAKKLFDGNKDNPNFVIIDVSSSYSVGHIAGAVDYPILDGSFEKEINNLNKKGIYLIYSRTDSDSLNAAQKLADNNFENVYRLKGNLGAWIVAGYPIAH